MITIHTTSAAALCLCATTLVGVLSFSAQVEPEPPNESRTVSRVIHVAPATGEREADRTSILAALDQAGQGDTIHFAPGTYRLGGSIRVSVPGVTLLGSQDGTTLRGCEPDELVDYEPDSDRCAGLELTRGHQTVRDLTFEHMSWATLQIVGESGPGDQPDMAANTEGGHLIENNTFRDSDSFDVISDASEPIVIRNNTFINTYHAVAILGRNVHFLNNRISAPAPQRIPYGRADIAIGVAQFDTSGPGCADNLIAGNSIEGHSDGIAVGVFAPGTSCRGNVIRENTIAVSRAALAAGDRTFLGPNADSIQVGVALRMLNYPEWCGAAPAGEEWEFCPPDDGSQAAELVDNVIEGNRIVGSEGIAIELLHASRNRITGNTISAVERWDRFPAGVLRHPPEWGDANGGGIWLSRGSDENEIAGNMFENLDSSAVVLEGDSNRVEILKTSEDVRDLGSGNRVTTEIVSGRDAAVSGEIAYENKFVETRGVRLHYLDFGGSGLPVIFVHDWYEDAYTWTSFAPLFADAYRVLAMTRRGYGESDDVGWGYDVATQSEDILGFMDALGIERAVLVGRHPTTQDMTWISEHHPDRLAGLVYLYHAIAPSPGEGRMLRDRTFAEMMMRYGGCWMGEEAYHRSAPRLLYRPHYIDDPELRIEVPAISFTHPRDFAAGAGDMEFLDLTLQMATGADPGGGYCEPAAIRKSVDYLAALANDPERLAEVRPLVPTTDERKRYADAFERAFGTDLRIIRLEQPADYRTNPEPYHAPIQAFLEEVAGREVARAAPAGGLSTGENNHD